MASIADLNVITLQRPDCHYYPFDDLMPGRYHIAEFFIRDDLKYNSGEYLVFYNSAILQLNSVWCNYL